MSGDGDARPLAWNRIDAIAITALVACALVAFFTVRDLPYHWDGADFVVNAARDLRASHFSPLIATHSDFAHPPLFVALLAAAWSVFGESVRTAHALTFVFHALLLGATYALGRRVGGARAIGIGAAAFVAASPVVLAEAGDVYVDLPVAAVVAAALALWSDERPRAAGVALSLAAAIKLPSLIVPLALALALATDAGARRSKAKWSALAAPFAVAAAWLVYHHGAAGWWLVRPGRGSVPLTAARVAHDLPWVMGEIFLEQGRWALFAVLALSIVLVMQKRALASVRGVVPLALVVALAALFFAFVGEFLSRYAIFVFPAYAVVALTLAKAAARPEWSPTGVRVWTSAVAALPVLAAIANWHPARPLTARYEFHPDDDLAYKDSIALGLDAAHWVEANAKDAIVYGAFPESYQLAEPWQGYVTQPIAFVPCRAFVPPAEGDARRRLVYVHAYSPGQRACKRLVELAHVPPVVRFVHGSKWLEIYALDR